MARYSNRRSKRGGDEDSGSRRSGGSSRGGRSSGGRGRGKKNDNPPITLGDVSLSKKFNDVDDVEDAVDVFMDEEVTFNAKVFLGKQEEMTIRNGDRLLIKFADYEKNPDWAVGKVFLMVEDD